MSQLKQPGLCSAAVAVTGSDSCSSCLRRTALIASLAGHFEKSARGTVVGDVMTLTDRDLIAALAGKQAGTVAAAYSKFDAETAWIRIVDAGLTVTCRHSNAYPDHLSQLDNPPAILHLAGVPDRFQTLLREPKVAIVGTRRPSSYGESVAYGLARDLSAAGVTVVSGMAFGIDSSAHAGALAAGGRTIAVLGSGADYPYPRSKVGLYRELVQRAAVVSELPPGFVPYRWCFPARNRIIAGVADLTLVIEGRVKSGSLITAAFARNYGRDVAALPGQVTSQLAAGTNALIADGAHLVTDAQDVLDLLFGVGARSVLNPSQASEQQLDGQLQQVVELISTGVNTANALMSAVNHPGQVLADLAELELLNLVHRDQMGLYQCTV